METKLTEQQSLAIITEMIDRARNNVQKGSGSSMIFWGSYIAAIAIANIVLIYTLNNPNQSFWVWCLAFFGVVVNYFIQRKVDKSAIVKSHIDKITSSVWMAFMISVVVFLACIFCLVYGTRYNGFFLLITPGILALVGIAEYVTGIATRFKPFVYGSIGMWMGAILASAAIFVASHIQVIQFAILAVCMLLGFVVTGVQLNRKAKEDV